MKNLFIILGTRPEIIKLSPIVDYLRKNISKKYFQVKVLYTNQHKEMGKELSNLFNFRYDHILNRDYSKNISFDLVDKIYKLLKNKKAYSVLVMGDTLSGVAGSIAAYLNKSKIFYVESGLRTGDFNEPWPEEGFRKIITHISNIHFAPTKFNKNILLSEGVIKKNIFITGNPVIDKIKSSIKKINKNHIRKKLDKKIEKNLKISNKEFVLLTMHRRENFGLPFETICNNINKISRIYPNIKFVYPVHPNPYVVNLANKFFKENKSVILTKPLNYDLFLRLLQKCKFILSDSGGIQEECTVLNKYVLLLRNKTERPEIKDKLVFVVGTNFTKLKKYFNFVNKNKKPKINYRNTFGNGSAAKKISNIIFKNFKDENKKNN